jgi:EAL and modified HD-GYP domain-containing signal transduction protein
MAHSPEPSGEPLLTFELLADASLGPGALLVDAFPRNEVGALTSETLGALQDLATRLPCLFASPAHGTAIAAASPDTLSGAGCQPVSADEIRREESGLPSNLQTGELWIAGSWFMQASNASADHRGASRASTLQLLQKVSADAPTRELEAVFRREPTLSYHLLRLVNSVGAGATRNITSLSQAIMILGRQQLRRWLNLLLFAAQDDGPQSRMLLTRAVCHARLLELLARNCGWDRAAQDQSFMTGLFSLLDILLKMPLVQVLEPLNLDPLVIDALLEHKGALGAHLQLADSAMRNRAADAEIQLAAIELPRAQFNQLQIEAWIWTLEVLEHGGV